MTKEEANEVLDDALENLIDQLQFLRPGKKEECNCQCFCEEIFKADE